MKAAQMRNMLFAAVLALAAVASAQHKHDHGKEDKKSEPSQKAESHEGHNHESHDDHHHEAPHGGTLLLLGDHFANLEFVIDSAKGKITAYALDSHAEKPVRLSQPEIEVAVRPDAEGATTMTLRLQAFASPLTGETLGKSSQFSATSPKLKGVKKFSGMVRSVTIKGSEFKDVSFKFPEGNE